MKKIIYAIAAFALILTGCAKEIDHQEKDTFSKVRLHVKVADQLTKVSADNDGRYHWQAGDKISVLNNSGTAFEFETEEGGSDVDFGASSFTGTLGKYAMYPANSTGHAAVEDDIAFNLPSTYTWSANSTNMPMLGKISGDKATFKAVGGVLKLVCYNIPADAVLMEFSATNKQISGEFEIADGTVDTPVILTSEKTSSNNIVNFDFTGNRDDNMVFYIPLPTGTIDGFTVTFYSDDPEELFTRTADVNLTVGRNQLIVAPSLNCDSASDAVLTNDELVSKADADSWSSYKNGSITNSYGTWSYNAAYQGNFGGDGKYYIQITSGREPVSYIQLPSFDHIISQIILHSVTNGSNGIFAGTVNFASSSTEPVTSIAATPSASSAKEDLTIDIPSGYTTGYLKATSACRIAAITVKFKSGAYVEPSLSAVDDPINIAVSSGDVNSASTTVTYSTSLADDLGVSIASHSDWITPTLSGTGPYTLTVSADKKVTAGDREDGFVTLRASGVTKTISVIQPSAFVPDPEITVVPGNGYFTATWTKHANAAGYVIYLGDPENGGTNISDDAGLSYDSGTNKYTLTKSVVNDDYDLYVSVTPAANYVGQDGYSHESFTCSATSYTVTITQPASGGSFTANGKSVTFTASQGDVIELEATPESSSYKFVSWTITGVSPASTTNASTTFTMPAGNVTVTATFAAKEWRKVTDDSTLEAGQQIILVSTVAGSKTDAYNGTFAADGTITSNVMGKVSATITSNILTSYTGAQVFTLGKSGDYWTLSNGSSLLGSTANKKIEWGSGTTTWTISISDGVATIDNTESTYGKIKYNRDSPRFTTYTGDFTTSMAGPMIFRYE